MAETCSFTEKLTKLLALLGPFSIAIGTWLIWKHSYYGELLPNTFYAKVPDSTPYKHGFLYLYLFFLSYFLIPYPLLMIANIRKVINKKNIPILILVAVISLWSLYIVRVGGDFMEFRFMVPILPFVLLLVTWSIFTLIKEKNVQAVFVVMVLIGTFSHKVTFGKVITSPRMQSVEQLSGSYKKPGLNWPRVGQVLGESFHFDQNIVIATGAAGAIPYYSRLTTVDILGLNDKWIARYGIFGGSRPGHQRMATLGYLLKRKVNLAIGGAKLLRNDQIDPNMFTLESLGRYGAIATKRDQIPADSRIIVIPIDPNYSLMALYLHSNPLVEETIRDNSWETYPILNN